MTCKDCYHYEKCYFEALKKSHLTGSDYREIVCIDNQIICKYFKDKSRIIELPCNIGDYVYYVTFDFNNVRIPKKAKVISFGINENGVFDVKLESKWSTFVLPINEIFFNIHCVEKYLKELNKK